MTINTPAPIGAPVPRYKIGYRTDEWGERSSTPGGIPDPAGAWVRYDDHAAALASAAQPAVPPGYVLVPDAANMTDAQAEAIAEQANCCGGTAYDIYRAALAAAPKAAPAPAAQGDALTALIEHYGRVVFQRCRIGHVEGAIRWDIELGYCDLTVSGATLPAAIDAARAAKEGGAP